MQQVNEGPSLIRKSLVFARIVAMDVGLAHIGDSGRRRLDGDQEPTLLGHRRIAIALARARELEALLFDEPTSALDTELEGEVLAAIRSLAAKHDDPVLRPARGTDTPVLAQPPRRNISKTSAVRKRRSSRVRWWR
jgi:hypothetical protein